MLQMQFFIYKISCLLLLLISTYSFAQDSLNISFSTLKKAEIKWDSQWPTNIEIKKSNNLSSKINEIVLGKKKYLLSKPVSLIVDSTNTYWVLDQGNKSIIEIKNNEGNVPHFIEKKIIDFPSLLGICCFNNNQIIFTDSYLNKIYLLNNEKKEFRVLNDSLKLNQPTGIAYSKTNNEIWVVETGKHRIVILNAKGEIIKTIGQRGESKGEFNFPTNISIDKLGNAYIVDAMNFRVQIFDKTGAFISSFGSHGDATGYFASPKGIATDTYGNIYVVDALLNNVQVFDIKGNLLYYFGTQGTEIGQFWMPSGIYINSQNKIFVADSYNSRIQTFNLINCIKK